MKNRELVFMECVWIKRVGVTIIAPI